MQLNVACAPCACMCTTCLVCTSSEPDGCMLAAPAAAQSGLQYHRLSWTGDFEACSLTLELLMQTICGHLGLDTLEPAGSCQTYLASQTHCTSVKPSYAMPGPLHEALFSPARAAESPPIEAWALTLGAKRLTTYTIDLQSMQAAPEGIHCPFTAGLQAL